MIVFRVVVSKGITITGVSHEDAHRVDWPIVLKGHKLGSGRKVIALVLLLTAFASAQVVPDAPKPEAPVVKSFKTSTAVKLSIFTAFAGTVADVESTQLKINQGCVESNVLYGARPSRTKMYAINLPVAAGVSFATLYFQKKYGGKGWWASPFIVGAFHSAAAIHNFTVSCS